MRREDNPKHVTTFALIAGFVIIFSSSLWAQTDGNAAAAPPTLTLQQAIDMAITGNRLLKNSSLDVSNAKSEIATTRIKGKPNMAITAAGSQLLAPVHFSFSQGIFGDFPVIGPIPPTNTTVTSPATFSVIANATLLQPLTQLRRVHLGVRMKKAAAQISQEDWRSQRNGLVSNVKQLYYGLAQIQSAQDTVKESIKFLTELERFVSDNVTNGTALDSDLLEVQAKLARQQHELATLNSSYAGTKEKMNVVLGREISTDFSITSVPEAAAPAKSLAELQSQALECRPEVRQAKLKARIAGDDEMSKRSESTPDISLGLTYTRQQNIDVVPQELITAGVIVSWQDPFDWGRRKLERSEKSRIVEKANNGLQETKSQVLVDVNMKYRNLQDALSLLDADRLEVKAQEEKRRVTMNRYKENSSLLKDVLEVDTSLADANRQYLQDQLDAATARAQLDQAVGED
ncbi:TolC family protein [bacterium]|nr:TolC family protein [bacterium]